MNNRPRENVSWFDAKVHCERRDTRLPTEREWEYAARGPDNLIYPWGDEFIRDNAQNDSYFGEATADVGSRPGEISWVGAYDMSGNVSEWVNSIYDNEIFSDEFRYPYADDGREDLDRTDIVRVLRGGSWIDVVADFLRAADREWGIPGDAGDLFGFRCSRSLSD